MIVDFYGRDERRQLVLLADEWHKKAGNAFSKRGSNNIVIIISYREFSLALGVLRPLR